MNSQKNLYNEINQLSYDVDEILNDKKLFFLLKRTIDITMSIVGIIIFLPLLLLVGILIKMDSRGPIFFQQVRVGKKGKLFKIIKFRTMIENNNDSRALITTATDVRITRIGSILRKYKIDELPQLINVFVGDMSFVGPRPEVKKYVDMYREDQKIILKIRPGITDIASIEFRNENYLLENCINPEEVYINEIMLKKINLNIKYIRNLSIFNDIKLIVKTICIVLFD